MKSFRIPVISLFLAGMAFACLIFFAHRGYPGTEDPDKATSLKDSAKILASSHPDLSKKLFEYAYQEEQETRKQKRWNDELVKVLEDASLSLGALDRSIAGRLNLYGERIKNAQDARREYMDSDDDIELLRDSGAILQESNPSLAEKLTKLAGARAARLQWARDMGSMESEEKGQSPVAREQNGPGRST